jgi:hypothetical protein
MGESLAELRGEYEQFLRGTVRFQKAAVKRRDFLLIRLLSVLSLNSATI